MSTIGENLKLTVYGCSHDEVIGMKLSGIRAGLPVNEMALQAFMERRAPGRNEWSTPRKEPDKVEFISGITGGMTDGNIIEAIIRNTNTRSGDYEIKKPRPGHADYAAFIKYGEIKPGGGQFSGRLTAPLCIAGGMCKQWLKNMGIQIGAHINSIADITDTPFDPICPEIDKVDEFFPTLDTELGAKMRTLIADTHKKGDSVGGTIECAVTGMPAGIGDALFDGIEGKISQLIFGIPAVKGIQFGDTQPFGSENNDPFTVINGQIRTATNHCGGILGGISNGMSILFTAQLKPTPSIALPQRTVDLTTGQITTIEVKGRHDPCIVPRAVPVVEAATAIAIYDMILERRQ